MSQTSSFSLPIGPVHVALEEPVYFHLDVDGETVRKVEITSGHVHRGMEGMATQRNFFKNTTLTERVCSLCSNSHSLTYCMAVENVLGMTPPPRAQYLRVLAEETKRVASHLFNIAIFAHNVGFKSLFLHIMEVRENMQDVKETIYGNRMNLSANCIGGVKFDMDDSLTVYMLERLDTVEEAVKRVEKVFRTDPLIAKRSRGVGVLSREDAWALGVVGPVARGSGLDIDVRKNTPYLVYPDLYFDIVKEQDGDVWSRAMVRVREVFESIRLLRQCLDKLPDGPLAVHMERIPESESVARSEAPRGELIYYLQTNGTDTPARLKWRVPSYMNWEANHLEFSENTAPAGCVPGLSGLRILVLSDVHTNLPLLEKAAAMAEQARPDMIVFLGDLYTDFLRATHAGDYITQMKRLSSIAPAYACLGNHDMALVDNVERILKEGGFTLLRNSAAFVTIPRLGNAEFKLVGLGDLREGDFFPDRCMSPRELGEESVMPTIVLSHNPKGRELLGGYHWNLMLSGHTHGGQIKLPFFSTPLLTSEGETMYSGFHPYEDKQVFVTRGIGYIGPGRFNCPPEINLITIP